MAIACTVGNASNIWLPVEFSADGLLVDTPLKYREEWNLDLDGAWTNATTATA
jgi:hypothetical protein